MEHQPVAGAMTGEERYSQEQPDISEKAMPKLGGFEFWRKTLKGATRVVAPMVDQSELAWRLLSRRHDAELCYTPMLNSKIFVNHPGYRAREFQTHPEDHPLIAQFCGDCPETLLRAAKMVQHQVDAVDLNLGCPQNIARKGHYGCYLQDEWELIRSIISTLHRELSVPVTCKIRVFDDVEKSIKYAQMVEEAGAQLVTIHGRTREQRGQNTGLADWEKIKIMRESLSVPVFANGNILFRDDIDRCLAETGAQGVMVAEGNLYNPAIFEDKYCFVWDLVDEYLDICRHEAPASLTAVRGHLFKMYRSCLHNFVEQRAKLGEAKTFEQAAQIAAEINSILRAEYNGVVPHVEPPFNRSETGPAVKHWFCQSYIRDMNLYIKSRQPPSLNQPDGPIKPNNTGANTASASDIEVAHPAKLPRTEDRCYK